MRFTVCEPQQHCHESAASEVLPNDVQRMWAASELCTLSRTRLSERRATHGQLPERCHSTARYGNRYIPADARRLPRETPCSSIASAGTTRLVGDEWHNCDQGTK